MSSSESDPPFWCSLSCVSCGGEGVRPTWMMLAAASVMSPSSGMLSASRSLVADVGSSGMTWCCRQCCVMSVIAAVRMRRWMERKKRKRRRRKKEKKKRKGTLFVFTWSPDNFNHDARCLYLFSHTSQIKCILAAYHDVLVCLESYLSCIKYSTASLRIWWWRWCCCCCCYGLASMPESCKHRSIFLI